MAQTGLLVPVDEEETQQEKLQKLIEGLPELPPIPGARIERTQEGYPYYVPTDEPTKPELPIPYISLPDVPKEPIAPPTELQPEEIPIPRTRPADAPAVKEPTRYDITPPEIVPETPQEQLGSLVENLPDATPEEPTSPETPPEQPPPETPPQRDPLEFASDPVRRFAAHAIGETLALPWTLSSLAATGQQAASEVMKKGIAKVGGALAEPIGTLFPRLPRLNEEKIKEIMSPPEAPTLIGDLEKSWEKFGKSFVDQQRKIWGVTGEPKTGVEKFSQFTGESFTPAKQFTLPITFGAATIRQMLDSKQGLDITSPAEAGFMESRQGGPPPSAVPGAAPGTAPWTPPAPAPKPGFIPAPAPTPKPGVTQTVPGMPKPSTAHYGLKQRKGGPNSLPETDEEFARRVDAKRVEVEAKKAEEAKKFTPTVMDFFKDFGARPPVPEFGILGGIAAGTAVLATLPWTLRAIKNMRGVRIPTPRPVTDAAPGTMTVADPKLYTRYFDDATTAALNFLRKAGIEPSVIDHLELTARMATRAGMRAQIDRAIKQGEFRSVNLNFKAPVALTDIARKSTPQTDEYLKYLAAFEDFINEAARPKWTPTKANPTPGLPTVAGMTEAQIRAGIRAIEQSPEGPLAKEVAKDFAAWKRARRKFEVEGPYNTMPATNPNWNNPAKANNSFQWLDRQAKYSEGKEPVQTPFARRESPIVAEERHAREAFANKMENDYVMRVIKGSEDTMQGRTNIPLFKEVTLADLKANPEWKGNTIRVFENGETKYYTTDPTLRDQLLFDPVSITDPVAQAVYAAKRMVEITNTGLPAFWFAPVDAARLWMQAKFTAPPGRWHPSLIHMAMSIPGQWVPQAAKAAATWLEHGSGGNLAQFLGGKQNVDKLAESLVKFFDWTYYGQIEKMGSARGSMLAQEPLSTAHQKAQLATQLATGSKVANEIGGATKAVWNAYASLVSAVHESTGFAYTVQNWRKASPQQIVSEARKLGGDPRITGEFKVIPVDPITGEKGTPRVPRFESPELGERLDAAWGKAWGRASHIGRISGPWFNPTEQAIKSIGKAYLDNPVRFMRDTWLYIGLPVAANYYWNYSLGNDPTGRSYVDHLTEGRTPYASQMRMYWGWPGKNVEDGVEHDLMPQEFSFVARMYTLGMHHALGKAKVFDEVEDFKRAASGLLDVAIDPAAPSVMSVWETAKGLNPTRGLFGGTPTKRRDDPFDENGGMPQSLEAFARTLFGGVAQIAGAGAAAYTHTNSGFADGLKNGAKAALRTANEKTMFIRDITGDLPPMSMSTDISKAMFERQRVIDELAHFYNNPAQAGGLNVKGGTTAGGQNLAMAPDKYNLGPTQAPEIPGLAPGKPTNPLYQLYMEEMYNYFKHDSPNPVKGEDQGGIGYKTIWARHGDASAALKSLKKVDEGNFTDWQQQLDSRPLAKAELERAGVDTTSIRQVKNYYIKKMQDVDRAILYAQLAVERKISRQANQPITIWDIRPYGKGVEGEPGSFIFTDLLDMNWGTDPAGTGPVPSR